MAAWQRGWELHCPERMQCWAKCCLTSDGLHVPSSSGGQLSALTTVVPLEHPWVRPGLVCVRHHKNTSVGNQGSRALCAEREERGHAGMSSGEAVCQMLMAGFAGRAELLSRGLGCCRVRVSLAAPALSLPHSAACMCLWFWPGQGVGLQGQSLPETVICSHQAPNEKTITGCYFVWLRGFLTLKPV